MASSRARAQTSIHHLLIVVMAIILEMSVKTWAVATTVVFTSDAYPPKNEMEQSAVSVFLVCRFSTSLL